MTTKLQPSNNKLGGYGSIEIRNEQEEDPLLSLSASATRTSNLDPYANSSRWSQLTFGWLSPVLELSNAKGRLDVDDLRIIPLPFDDSTSHVTDQFQKSWAAEVERAASLDIEPTLLRALWGAYYLDFCKAGFLKFVHDLLQFVGPQVLNGLVTYIRTPDAPLWHGLSLTLIVTVAQIIMSITLRHYFFTCYRVGLRLRTAVVTAIYQKALVIAGNRKSVGEITNLMSVDAQRLQDIVTSLHSIWYSCLQITLAVFFLWQQMGVSILSGVFVIILSGPLTAISAGYMGRLQKDLMISKDKRIEVNNEVLGNMKIVKLQAWEKPFQEKLEGLRSRELNHLFWYLVGRMFTFLTFSAVPLCISLATFGTYVLLGNKLDVASALTALALFEILRFPLYMLPNTINSMVEANVALNRVNSFLVSPEHQYVSTGSLPDVGVHIFDSSFVYENKRPSMNAAGIDSKLAKDISDADWEMKLLREQVADAERKLSDVEGRPRGEGTSSNLIALSRVNVKVEKGEFIAVVGGVGSGKSTLLKALLGELRQLSGGMHVRGSVSYSAQSSFIMNATVKENILFGKRNDNQGLYKKALEVCALEHDLELLPQGDLTEIGEKGITLSGGQKARIGMARALYHDADIFLLDDPLAAVDANVGRQIFEDCIVKTMLAPTPSGTKRTVILVTNALQYLSHPLVDRIVVLKEGSIIETGTYDELNGAESSQFKTYLNSFNQTRVEKRDNESGGTEKVATTVDDTEPGQFDGSTAEKAGSVRKEERVSLSKASLMTDEMQERETGTVSLSVYLTWAKAAGGYWVIGVLFAAFAVSEGSTLLSNWFLTYWSAHGSEDLASQIRFLGFYALINVMAIFFNVFRSIILMLVALRASRKLFTRVLDATMRAPMSFFDTTPLGRIINRFSKDMYTVDENLPNTLEDYLFCLFEVVSTLILVSAVTPIFAVCLLPILYGYNLQQKYFNIAYRELKRLDSVQRSPIYALFGETLDGVSTIRAFQAQQSLLLRMMTMLDSQQHAYFLTTTAQAWLGVRLELMGTGIVFAACLAAVLNHDTKSGSETFAGLAGLSISYALSVTQSLNWTVRVSSDFEAHMVSVERLEQYSTLKSEAPRETSYDESIPNVWPDRGVVEFQRVKLRYRPDLPLVLKGLDLTLPSHSKVGIVGRTGAGKSTLMTALMRLVEIESGKILIDGVDIRLLGLQRVRSKIAVIPQDPVLFSGTIQTNLDPFGEFSPVRLQYVLKRVGLMDENNDKACVQSLEDEVMEGGNNFSVGQRQLLVIGRALLQEASVIICDEATAAVDAETDARMQAIFRIDFKHATCLTVAHRLNTIMDSDYVLVMHDGKAAEFDTPGNLLEMQDGIFRGLVHTWEKEHSQ